MAGVVILLMSSSSLCSILRIVDVGFSEDHTCGISRQLYSKLSLCILLEEILGTEIPLLSKSEGC